MGTFDTISMLRSLEIMKPPQSVLLDAFFPILPDSYSVTDTVQIDIYKGKRKMAPFVHPLAAAKAESRAGYDSNTIKPPYVKPLRPSSAADWINRAPGENPYAARSIQQRAADMMNKDLIEMDQEITRREEWMAAQQLCEGKFTAVGEGVNLEIDLKFSATHLLANTSLVANGWDQTGNNPIKDLRMAGRLIAQDSGKTAVKAYFGANAWDLFMASAAVQAYFDKLHIIPGTIEPQGPASGAQLQARGVEGLELWTYYEWFLDDNGAEQPMIPDDYVVIGSTAARAQRHYAAIMDDDAPGGAPVRAFPTSWKENNPPVRYVMMQSAPLPAVHEVDGFVRLKVKA